MSKLKHITLSAAIITSTLAVIPGTAEAANGRCTKYEQALRQHQPRGGWDVARMSRYAYRESRCLPHVRSTTRDTGLLQINDVNHSYLTRALGVRVTKVWLQNPTNNIRAAAALCSFWKRAGKGCYHPWKL